MELQNLQRLATGETCESHPVEGVVVQLFRSNKYRGKRDGTEGFRPDLILKNGQVIWSFREQYADTNMTADIVHWGEEQILVTMDKRAVYSVMRLADVPQATFGVFGKKIVVIGGSSKELLLEIKIAAAEALGLQYWYDDFEGEILRKWKSQAAAVSKQQESAQPAPDTQKKVEALKRREQFRTEVMARKTVEAWSLRGSHLFGIPITSDREWQCLPGNTFCILMKDDQPVEAFIVMKDGTRKKRDKVVEVTGTRPQVQAREQSLAAMPTIVGQRSVTLKGVTKDIFLVASAADAKQLVRVDSDTWVGVLKDDTLTIYGMKEGMFNPLGELKKKVPTTA